MSLVSGLNSRLSRRAMTLEAVADAFSVMAQAQKIHRVCTNPMDLLCLRRKRGDWFRPLVLFLPSERS
jgi:hypothetical protein